jgi:predicted DNA-binding transcriptional regulator AlpA
MDTTPLADRDPDQMISVPETCEFLGVSKPTLYRISGLRRVKLSPGRVGYRVGDVLQYSRDTTGHDLNATGAQQNFAIFVAGETDAAEFFATLDRRIRTILVRKPAHGKFSGRATIDLPPAAEWGFWGAAHHLTFIDSDGIGNLHFVPADGESILGQSEFLYVYALGAIHLKPLLSDQPDQPDGWWVV